MAVTNGCCRKNALATPGNQWPGYERRIFLTITGAVRSGRHAEPAAAAGLPRSYVPSIHKGVCLESNLAHKFFCGIRIQ
jgi:hypothetical protein